MFGVNLWSCNRHFIQNCIYVRLHCLFIFFAWVKVSCHFAAILWSTPDLKCDCPPVSHLGPPAVRCLKDCCRSSENTFPLMLGASQTMGKTSPSSRLSPGDVPLCGSETPRCWAVWSTPVWTVTSQLRIPDNSGGTGGSLAELLLVSPSLLSYSVCSRTEVIVGLLSPLCFGQTSIIYVY